MRDDVPQSLRQGLVIGHSDQITGITCVHPVDLGALLWSVRSVVQTTTRLRLVLSGRPGLERELTSEQAAFYQDGRWVKLARPGPEVWRRLLPSFALDSVDGLLTLSEGHVPTALAMLDGLDGDSPVASALRERFATLAATQGQHAARCVQHARTLDRLGGEVLLAIAQGRGPYTGTGYGHPRDAQRAVNRLRLAGLVDAGRPGRTLAGDRPTRRPPAPRRDQPGHLGAARRDHLVARHSHMAAAFRAASRAQRRRQR